MRIALVLHGWPPAAMGGTGLYVEALAGALRAAGHQAIVIAPGPTGPLGLTEGPDRALLSAPRPQRWEETYRNPGIDALFASWLRRWRPDVVHFHHLSGLSVGLVAACRRAGVRAALTLHDYALPCARGQLLDDALRPCAGPQPARCAGCLSDQLRLDPVKAQVGRLLAPWPGLRQRAREALRRAEPSAADRLRLADRQAAIAAALRGVDALLAPSADLAERMAGMGLPRPRLLDLPLLRPIQAAPTAESGPLRILFASSLIPSKGPDLLLAAFARLPAGQATLTLAGPAPPYDGRLSFAADLAAAVARTPGARLLPAVPAAEIGALLAAHDLLALPSRWPENSPLVVREATAAGLPVLVSALGGAAELAPDARQVPPGDVDALAAALAAEVALGRRRLPPARWSTPEEHAAALVAEVYTC